MSQGPQNKELCSVDPCLRLPTEVQEIVILDKSSNLCSCYSGGGSGKCPGSRHGTSRLCVVEKAGVNIPHWSLKKLHV